MSSVSSIALSGMRAAEVRLNAAASNIANAQSSSADGLPYQPVDVVQVDVSSGGQPGGTLATYAPRAAVSASPADAGTAEVPEVDLASELIQAHLAQIQYEASLKMFEAGSEMDKATLDIVA